MSIPEKLKDGNTSKQMTVLFEELLVYGYITLYFESVCNKMIIPIDIYKTCLFWFSHIDLAKHDSNDPDALILWHPDELILAFKDKDDFDYKSSNKLSNNVMVPIVVDPRLAKKLRHHQRDGVKFVYRCMMNTNYAKDNQYGEGCILGKIFICLHIYCYILTLSI